MIGIFIVISLLLVILINKQVDATVSEAFQNIDTNIISKISLSKTEIKKLESQLDKLSKLDKWKLAEQALDANKHLKDLDLDLVTIRIELEATSKEIDKIIMQSELEGDAGIALELRIRREELQKELDEFRRRKQIIYLISDEEEKIPIVLEFSNNQIVVTSTDQSRTPLSYRNFEDALSYTNSLPNREDYYLLIVLKPSGMQLWNHFKYYVHQLRKSGGEIDFGIDLIAEKHTTSNEFVNSKQE